MSNSKLVTIVGTVILDNLFKRSKSEGLYPVLICEDNMRYRIHVNGNQFKDTSLLAHLDGLTVRLTGNADDIKGHYRIVIDPDFSESIHIINQSIENIKEKFQDKKNEIEHKGFPIKSLKEKP
jgi:hypothetical protein